MVVNTNKNYIKNPTVSGTEGQVLTKTSSGSVWADVSSSTSFTLETVTATAGASTFTLTKSFSASKMLVFYNGLLINSDVHYTYADKVITLVEFTAEADDIITVVGLLSTTGGTANAENLIGGAY